MARYNLLQGNVHVDQEALLETIFPDPEEANRVKATPEQIERNIQVMAQQQQAKASMGGTRGEQAVMGGAAQRSGING